MQHEQREHDRIPPELDPSLAPYDDERPPRTMRRRLQPILWVVGAATMIAMVLLVSPGI